MSVAPSWSAPCKQQGRTLWGESGWGPGVEALAPTSVRQYMVRDMPQYRTRCQYMLQYMLQGGNYKGSTGTYLSGSDDTLNGFD